MLHKLRQIQLARIEEPKKTLSIKLVFYAILGIYFMFFHKGLFFVILFEIVDFLKNTLKFKTHILPIDLSFIFGITGSYFFSPVIGVMIQVLSMVNRFAFGFFQRRHAAETVRHIILFFIVYYIRSLPFMLACYIMLGAKYVFQYLTDSISADSPLLTRIPYHICNIVLSVACFIVIDKFSFLLQ